MVGGSQIRRLLLECRQYNEGGEGRSEIESIATMDMGFYSFKNTRYVWVSMIQRLTRQFVWTGKVDLQAYGRRRERLAYDDDDDAGEKEKMKKRQFQAGKQRVNRKINVY